MQYIKLYINIPHTDIDECAENSSLCEHICNNTEGNYTCDCDEGYELNSNGYSCTGEAMLPLL